MINGKRNVIENELKPEVQIIRLTEGKTSTKNAKDSQTNLKSEEYKCLVCDQSFDSGGYFGTYSSFADFGEHSLLKRIFGNIFNLPLTNNQF